jgi:predicted nucleotide-binding protein (sugar kinase/HSP70/actin superfamily)
MATVRDKKVAFPRMAHYNVAFRYFIERGLGATYIMQPEMTRRTLEIGSRYSPDFICAPFKHTLGSLIEALECGANTIVAPGGPCRLAYYGELEKQILNDLGYEFEFLDIAELRYSKPKDYIKLMRKLNPKLSVPKMLAAAADTLRLIEQMDEIEEIYHQNMGFEVEKDSFKKAYTKYLHALDQAENGSDLRSAYAAAKDAMTHLPTDKPDHPLRVGIIGEYYTVMDSFSNLNLEEKLAKMGTEVYRWMNISNRNIGYNEKNLLAGLEGYSKYVMGPTTVGTLHAAKRYGERHFDGIIHVKSFGCTPEVDAVPAIQTIGRDYKVPLLFLSYDSQTSDTGLNTRLEAFYDMISMRKKTLQ